MTDDQIEWQNNVERESKALAASIVGLSFSKSHDGTWVAQAVTDDGTHLSSGRFAPLFTAASEHDGMTQQVIAGGLDEILHALAEDHVQTRLGPSPYHREWMRARDEMREIAACWDMDAPHLPRSMPRGHGLER